MAEKLKLDILEAGCKDKAAAVRRICKAHGVTLEDTVYIGDDINDLKVIRIVGFGCCPADALPQVKNAADFVTAVKCEEGVIREELEMILGRQTL